jgi:hypothetical protein
MHECPGEGYLLALDRPEEILRTVSAEGRERREVPV